MSANSKTLGKRPGGLSDRASDVVLVVLSIAILLVVLAIVLVVEGIQALSRNKKAAAAK